MQIWRSRGKNLRSIGQKSINDILIEYNISPFGCILNKTFGMIILWKWPSFSLEKNKSGFHILSGSVNVKNFIRPFISWYCNRSSFHCSLKVTWIAYSWKKNKCMCINVFTIYILLLCFKRLTIATSSMRDILLMYILTRTITGPSENKSIFINLVYIYYLQEGMRN